MMTDDIRKNWENLYVPELIMQAIEKEGFVNPTEIQKLALPSAIKDRLDILGAAATGTGKTLAFGIPMVARIIEDKRSEIEAYEKANNADILETSDVEIEYDENSEEFDLDPSGSELEYTWNDDDVKPEITVGVNFDTPLIDNAKPYQHIYGLVLTPTRELACQVADHLKKICQFTDLKVCAIFGGMSVEKQERLLRYRPEILVVTPGRFWSFINDQELHALTVARMSVLVIDEADRLLEQNHFAEVHNLLEWLKSNKSDSNQSDVKVRQTFVFSATLTFVHTSSTTNQKVGVGKTRTKNDKLKKIVAELGMVNGRPHIIDTTLDVAKLQQWKILCPTQADKDSRLFWFLRQHKGRTIVFVNSKNSVRRLSSILRQLHYRPKSLFADMTEKQRLKNLESFSSGVDSLMIASDVAARGLDIPRVDFVVHFDVAHTAETHLHRSGRTARAAHPGNSVIMVTPKEAAQLRKLLYSLKKTDDDIGLISIDDIGVQVENVVQLARKIESECHVASKVDKEKEWFEKMAEEADVLLDEDFAPSLKKGGKSNDRRGTEFMKLELAKMLAQLDKEKTTFVSPIPKAGAISESELKADHVATVVVEAAETAGKRKKKNRGKKNAAKKAKIDN